MPDSGGLNLAPYAGLYGDVEANIGGPRALAAAPATWNVAFRADVLRPDRSGALHFATQFHLQLESDPDRRAVTRLTCQSSESFGPGK